MPGWRIVARWRVGLVIHRNPGTRRVSDSSEAAGQLDGAARSRRERDESENFLAEFVSAWGFHQ
jgi:hypothetical protein